MKGDKKKVGYKVIDADKKKESAPKSSAVEETAKEITPHREVCYFVLKENNKPMHYKKITEEVLKRCKSVGETPQNTIFARMTTDNKNRFKKTGKGTFGLAEWDNKPEEVKQDAN